MEHFNFIEQKIDIPGPIALLVATPLLVFIIRNVILSKASKNWPKVNGTIIEISKMRSRNKFALEYGYEALGHTYKNCRIFYSNTQVYSNKLAIEFDKKYSKHQIVDVFYNLKRPNQAVLEPGRSNVTFIEIAMLGVIMIYGLLAVFVPDLYAQLSDDLFQLFN